VCGGCCFWSCRVELRLVGCSCSILSCVWCGRIIEQRRVCTRGLLLPTPATCSHYANTRLSSVPLPLPLPLALPLWCECLSLSLSLDAFWVTRAVALALARLPPLPSSATGISRLLVLAFQAYVSQAYHAKHTSFACPCCGQPMWSKTSKRVRRWYAPAY
jgi:hypothetical protein